MRDKFIPLIDERASADQYHAIDESQMMLEEEVIQEDIITKYPGLVKFMVKYEWRPLAKVVGAAGIIFAAFLMLGIEGVIGGLVIFGIALGVMYIVHSNNIGRDTTIFLEAKCAGQKIEPGDHSPYEQTFVTTENRLALWEVPNVLIKNGLFRFPGGNRSPIMPGADHIICVDLFDRVNRTCVMPRDMDVANIALVTNMNPMLANKMNAVAEEIKHDRRTQELVMDMYRLGNISAKEARDVLQPIEIRQAAFMKPNEETKRNIFFELQNAIPDLRRKYQEVSNKIFLYADFLASRWLYQAVNKPMPENIKKDHDFVDKVMGVTKVSESNPYRKK